MNAAKKQEYYFFTEKTHKHFQFASDEEAIANVSEQSETVRIMRQSDSVDIWKKPVQPGTTN